MAKPNKNNRLGRGLSALLKDEPTVKTAQDEGAKKLVGNILEIDLEKITANPWQPRTNFDKKALEELVSSIQTLGVIQPITIRKKPTGEYELISGERRFRASQLAGKKTIPAYVRLANDQEMLEMALVENIQRQDLDAIEIALSYQQLIDEIKLTQEELSKRVGKDRTSITNYLRLLKLDPIIQTGIRDGMISMGHGRALMAIDDTDLQFDIYEKIVKNNLSVRDTERLIKSIKEGKPEKKATNELPSQYKEALSSISNSLNTKVEIKRANNGKGKIILNFTSDDEFERLRKFLNEN
ncbi:MULTISPECIES: ParB/RepB/Spo0J family partition protein [Empedobacter]|uniref:ParB/RepB/Spo0J family partition protein n=1 Tax=Empedobacter falsenii TaxID=343874 RepID=A0A376G5Y6_9FLAO|nr:MULTISPECIES: ParB/RepB/Spo0J family partition protein [Empedobacter]HAR73723.1 ParB/RepB/Spo0J family partition protein [Flavobacteriaceae bacterium]MBW1617726.1 ParB/RepB/Spo0J family partition protein [Empedobacter falsenii]MDH0658070.1 ParB/RepB/Spo0J family partition protein [Empedobacter sp. GD03865]MDH0673658.1 ParB/RepB/Spo0J family partition protein [Empedobacter sp. GD03861]MDH1601835.1 ParB/RepB/Spo0J family partition protein [Empedobacter sp. GD03739]